MKLFMLLFTLTEIETEANKMTTVPNVINVSVQYEHLNTVLYKPFLSVSVSVGVVGVSRGYTDHHQGRGHP